MSSKPDSTICSAELEASRDNKIWYSPTTLRELHELKRKISLITDNDALQNICDVVKKAGNLSDMEESGYF